jgi:hypothetical protein
LLVLILSPADSPLAAQVKAEPPTSVADNCNDTQLPSALVGSPGLVRRTGWPVTNQAKVWLLLNLPPSTVGRVKAKIDAACNQPVLASKHRPGGRPVAVKVSELPAATSSIGQQIRSPGRRINTGMPSLMMTLGQTGASSPSQGRTT